MRRTATLILMGWCLSLSAAGADLSTAPASDLLTFYQQLRAIQADDQGGVAENVVFQRDAATFTFVDGRLTFARPVAGRVVAAFFEGQGRFELAPVSPIDQRQISRFARGPKLVDTFRQAVLFFTDDSYRELLKQINLKPGMASPDASPAFASAQKEYSEAFNDWIDNLRKGNPPMRNLAARMLADLSDPSSRGFFLAGFKGGRSGDLLFHVSWNRDPILLPDLNNGEEVMLLHINRDNYFEWWAGFHLRTEYATTPHPDHRTLLAHCRTEHIDAEIAKDNRLSATAEMEFEVPGGTARVLPFNLRGVLRISSIEDGAGNKLSFIQEDRKRDNDPWLILPAPARPGEIYKVKINYKEDSTHDSRVVDQRGSGLYYVTSRESWFPSFGAFDDRTQYEMHVQSPKKFKFVGSGDLVDSNKDKDSLETTWKSPIPLGVVGFNYGDFAEASQPSPSLTVKAYAGKEVPDELKNLESALDVASLARGPGAGNLDAQYGIMRGGFNTAANVKYAAGVSSQAFRLFEFYFGPLPFKTVSVTEQPVRGYGLSWPSLVFLPYDSLLDPTTRNSLHLSETAEAREFYNVVAIHEMSHQWWGHVVGWKTYHDQWLSEGFAEFSAALYLRQFDPKKLDGFWELKKKWLLGKNRAGDRPVEVGPLWLNYQLNQYLGENNAMFLIYYKGAYVLEMLRAMMVDPRAQNPDARFIAMMRDFVSTCAGKNASTADFQRIVEKHMGQPMDWFFNEWVYGTEIPNYDFQYQLSDAGGGKTELSMSLTQSGVSDSFAMRVPIGAVVNGQMRHLGLVSIQGSRTVSGKFPLGFRPEKVVLDPDRSVLCTLRQ